LAWLQKDRLFYNLICKHFAYYISDLFYADTLDITLKPEILKLVKIIENRDFQFVKELMLKCYNPFLDNGNTDINEYYNLGLYLFILPKNSYDYINEIKEIILEKFLIYEDQKTDDNDLNFFISSIPFSDILEIEKNCIFEIFRNTELIDIILIRWSCKNINSIFNNIDDLSKTISNYKITINRIAEIIKNHTYNIQNFKKELLKVKQSVRNEFSQYNDLSAMKIKETKICNWINLNEIDKLI